MSWSETRAWCSAWQRYVERSPGRQATLAPDPVGHSEEDAAGGGRELLEAGRNLSWVLPLAALGELVSLDFQAGLFLRQEKARDGKARTENSHPPVAQESPAHSPGQGWAVNQAVNRHRWSWPSLAEGCHASYYSASVHAACLSNRCMFSYS